MSTPDKKTVEDIISRITALLSEWDDVSFMLAIECGDEGDWKYSSNANPVETLNLCNRFSTRALEDLSEQIQDEEERHDGEI
jgi:hypothetical protein